VGTAREGEGEKGSERWRERDRERDREKWHGGECKRSQNDGGGQEKESGSTKDDQVDA